MLLLIAACSMQVYAQRMAPGKVGLEAIAASYSHSQPAWNYSLSLALTINGRNGGYQLWGFEYSHRQGQYKGQAIPLEAYTLEGGYSLPLLSVAAKSISLNAALSGVVGYESYNGGVMQFSDGTQILNEQGFMYGFGGRLSLEVFLSDHIVLLVQGRAKYFWASSGEALRPSVGAGLRYNF
jgi:hypothetical protein